VIFMGFRGLEALKDNLQDRGDCQYIRKSYKTSQIVGWVVGWKKWCRALYFNPKYARTASIRTSGFISPRIVVFSPARTAGQSFVLYGKCRNEGIQIRLNGIWHVRSRTAWQSGCNSKNVRSMRRDLKSSRLG
jgi:hypothetical protein